VILKKEDETRAKEENGFSGLVNKYRDEGKARNRNRYIYYTCKPAWADLEEKRAPRLFGCVVYWDVVYLGVWLTEAHFASYLCSETMCLLKH
jgi:hypothetical protein